MARRRLLSILTASAVLTAAFAGPAAALDVVEATQDTGTETTEEAAEATVAVAEEAIVDEPVTATTDEVGEAPVEVADAVEEVVAPSPSPSPEPSPSPSASPSPSTPEVPVARESTDTAGSDEGLVVAGDVGTAPSIAFLTGSSGSTPAPQSSFELPLASPVTAPAAPTTVVEAPQVADAPAEVADAPAPSVLAQAATGAVPEEGTPVVVLVAIASLVAAGVGAVRGERAATR